MKAHISAKLGGTSNSLRGELDGEDSRVDNRNVVCGKEFLSLR